MLLEHVKGKYTMKQSIIWQALGFEGTRGSTSLRSEGRHTQDTPEREDLALSETTSRGARVATENG